MKKIQNIKNEVIVKGCEEFFPSSRQKMNNIGFIILGSLIISMILVGTIYTFEEMNFIQVTLGRIPGMTVPHTIIVGIIVFTLGIFLGLLLFMYIFFKVQKDDCIRKMDLEKK
jgi:hypothetical protein